MTFSRKKMSGSINVSTNTHKEWFSHGVDLDRGVNIGLGHSATHLHFFETADDGLTDAVYYRILFSNNGDDYHPYTSFRMTSGKGYSILELKDPVPYIRIEFEQHKFDLKKYRISLTVGFWEVVN